MSQTPTETKSRPIAWAISGGARGMENQAMALAEAAGFDPVPLRVDPQAPWRWLPEAAWRLWGDVPKRLSGDNQTRLSAPWPQLVVGCGRLSVPLAIHIRRRAAGKTFVAQCQDPRVSPALFDMVVPPEHDTMPPSDNVVPIVGSPNLALPWRLAAAADMWRETFAALPRPLVVVAIGGSSKAYEMTRTSVEELFASLEAIQKSSGAGLAITASRRTGAENEALIHQHAARLNAWLWDGEGPSPILGLYALADAIVVTEDSVNMAAEAAASGKPVYVAGLAGGSEKFDHFHDALKARGISRLLGSKTPGNALESWSYPPLQETLRAGQELRSRMAAKGFSLPEPCS